MVGGISSKLHMPMLEAAIPPPSSSVGTMGALGAGTRMIFSD